MSDRNVSTDALRTAARALTEYMNAVNDDLERMHDAVIDCSDMCNQMVQNIDFAPTFLDLAGLKKPAYMPGTSLQPLFAGQHARCRSSKNRFAAGKTNRSKIKV